MENTNKRPQGGDRNQDLEKGQGRGSQSGNRQEGQAGHMDQTSGKRSASETTDSDSDSRSSSRSNRNDE